MIKYKTVLIIIMGWVISCGLSCKKKNETYCSVNAVLRNYFGANDCEWVFEIQGEQFEPNNLGDYTYNYYDGQKFKLSYQIVNTSLPKCQTATTIINVFCLEEE